jgi:hypothetical protein
MLLLQVRPHRHRPLSPAARCQLLNQRSLSPSPSRAFQSCRACRVIAVVAVAAAAALDFVAAPILTFNICRQKRRCASNQRREVQPPLPPPPPPPPPPLPLPRLHPSLTRRASERATGKSPTCSKKPPPTKSCAPDFITLNPFYSSPPSPARPFSLGHWLTQIFWCAPPTPPQRAEAEHQRFSAQYNCLTRRRQVQDLPTSWLPFATWGHKLIKACKWFEVLSRDPLVSFFIFKTFRFSFDFAGKAGDLNAVRALVESGM